MIAPSKPPCGECEENQGVSCEDAQLTQDVGDSPALADQILKGIVAPRMGGSLE